MIAVIRIKHRAHRDSRVSTHVGLVARAFGADKMFIAYDEKIKQSIEKLCNKFGGNFKIEFFDNYENIIKNWQGKIVHLTMYGEHINKFDFQQLKDKDILIIVGGSKVPPEIYELADFNIAIGNQPHSEVSALAVFLDRYFGGKSINKNFNGKIKIISSKKDKIVITM